MDVPVLQPDLKKIKTDFSSDNSVSLPGITGDGGPVGFEPGMFGASDDPAAKVKTEPGKVFLFHQNLRKIGLMFFFSFRKRKRRTKRNISTSINTNTTKTRTRKRIKLKIKKIRALHACR